MSPLIAKFEPAAGDLKIVLKPLTVQSSSWAKTQTFLSLAQTTVFDTANLPFSDRSGKLVAFSFVVLLTDEVRVCSVEVKMQSG